MQLRAFACGLRVYARHLIVLMRSLVVVWEPSIPLSWQRPQSQPLIGHPERRPAAPPLCVCVYYYRTYLQSFSRLSVGPDGPFVGVVWM